MDWVYLFVDKVKALIYGAAGWIVKQLVTLLDMLFNLVIDLINLIISAVGFAVTGIVQLLPVDASCHPCFFPEIPDVPLDGIINFINWILPVNVLACVIGVIVANYILYFTVGRILKFIQVA